MNPKYLLWAAAFFSLFTFIGHTMGLIQGPPLDQPSVANTYQLMQQTLVQMPVGFPKSIAVLMTGANACLSVYLLVTGLIFALLSKSLSTVVEKQILALNSAGAAIAAIISYLCFFPAPALCLALSAMLGFGAWKMKG